MAIRRASRTRSRAAKPRRSSAPRAGYRSAARKAKTGSRRAAPARRSAPQTLKIVIEHASVSEVQRPSEERPMGDGTIIKKPTKSQF